MEKNVQEESWEQEIRTPSFDVAAERAAQKRSRRTRWVYVIAAVVLCALAVLVYLTDTLAGESSMQLIGRHQSGVGMLTQEAPASQTFRAGENGLTAVDVMVSNYNKKVKEGVLTLWLTDEDGREIARRELPANEVKNNAFVTLALPETQQESAGKLYTLYASSDIVEQKGVTVRMGPLEATSTDLALIQPDGVTDYDNAMNIRLTYATKAPGTMGAAALGLCALALAAVVPLGSRKERRHG